MFKRSQAVDVEKGDILLIDGKKVLVKTVEHCDEFYAAAIFNGDIMVSRTAWLQTETSN